LTRSDYPVDDPTGVEDDPEAPDGSTSLVVAANEPATFDWFNAPVGDLTWYNVVEPLLEQLDDGSFQPLLAESYEVSDDGLEYVFTIREATFHDGAAVSADDVVYSLEAARDAPNAPRVSAPMEVVESIERVDDRTVTVRLSRPSQSFLLNMSRLSGMVIPEGSVDDVADNPIGTGPYVFGEWRHGDSLTFTQNTEYWGEAPFFDEVRWRFFPDDAAAVNAVLAGDVDIVNFIDEVELLEGVEAAADLVVVYQDSLENRFNTLILNGEADVFDDDRIRQAVAHALDRQALNDGLYGGRMTNICVPPDITADHEFCPYPYDPDRSRELLAEAGAEDLSLTLHTLTGGSFGVWVEILASQLAEVGITLEGRLLDGPALVEQVRNQGDYQMAFLARAAIDISLLAQCPTVWSRDCVPDETRELLGQADAAADQAEWAELRREVVESHAERAHWIPLHQVPIASVHRDDIAGFKDSRSWFELDLRPLSRG
jgi:peptide/nickel transport system substrate-binding protein